MPRYIISDPDQGMGWGHIFSEYDLDTDRPVERERITRFVFDTEQGCLVHLEIDRMGLAAADAAEVADVEDSLKNANPQALEDPETWGLIGSDMLPEWCVAPVARP